MAKISNYRQLERSGAILWQDDHLLVINKPAKLATIPERYDEEEKNLLSYLRKQHGDVYTVHRLDKDTSGVVCFAKNAEAHRNLSLQFQERNTVKIYEAIVHGKVQDEKGNIDAKLAPNRSIPGLMKVHPKGKTCLTEYEVLERFNRYTHVRVQLHTGRMHQIRVHFEYIGHRVAMDSAYGNQRAFYLSKVKKKYNLGKYEEERPVMDRQALHAKQLSFAHPVTKETLSFEAPLPKDMTVVLKLLRKWDTSEQQPRFY